MKRIKGRKYNFVFKTVRLPNGKTTSLEMVEHPGAVLVVPFYSQSKIILLKQYRPVFAEYIYELPAGTLEKGEPPAQCVRRELMEETGFSAKKFRKLGKMYLVPGYSNEVIHIFEARELFAKSATPDADEIIELLILSRGQVQSLFKARKIVDAKTIAALAFCGWL